MDKKQERLLETMDEFNCDIDVAEQMFIDEICDKYHTNSIEVAEAMFLSE